MPIHIRRREFIATLGGAAAWPLAAYAQQSERVRRIALASDVILASGTPSVAALQQATDRIPVVFAQVADPVGQGFVESLARPAGNITGFAATEFGVGAKLLELPDIRVEDS